MEIRSQKFPSTTESPLASSTQRPPTTNDARHIGDQPQIHEQYQVCKYGICAVRSVNSSSEHSQGILFPNSNAMPPKPVAMVNDSAPNV